MYKKFITLLLITIIALPFITCSDNEGPRPDQLIYEPLVFNPPKADDFRTTLSNGLVVYIAEDHEIPWFEASLMIKSGPFLEPENKIGLADMTSKIMREGGSKSMDGEAINERMDYLAGSVSATALSTVPLQ